MIPQRFTLDAMETGIGGVEIDSVPTEFTVCEQCGCLVAVERLARHPHDTTFREGAPREPLVKLTEPKPPRNETDIARWQTLALEKWLWYRDTVWPSPRPEHDIARAMHAHALAKLIPFLLGRPDLALDDISPEAVVASYGPDSGIVGDEDIPVERIVNRKEGE